MSRLRFGDWCVALDPSGSVAFSGWSEVRGTGTNALSERRVSVLRTSDLSPHLFLPTFWVLRTLVLLPYSFLPIPKESGPRTSYTRLKTKMLPIPKELGLRTFPKIWKTHIDYLLFSTA